MDAINRWLKIHGASELSFGRALRKFFTEQAERIADASENFHSLTPDQVPLVFRPDDEHAKLMPTVRRNVGLLMVDGARNQLNALERHRDDAKAFEEELIDLPEFVRQRIRQALDELTRQSFWREIQSTVQADLTGIIQQGLDDGATAWEMAKRIRLELGGDDARRRSMVIARTESTGALNSGHAAAIENAAGDGLITGKEWLAVGDKDTRDSHLALNGTTVGVKESFSVGGYPAPYPGHWSLPATERVRCRCTVVGAFAD